MNGENELIFAAADREHEQARIYPFAIACALAIVLAIGCVCMAFMLQQKNKSLEYYKHQYDIAKQIEKERDDAEADYHDAVTQYNGLVAKYNRLLDKTDDQAAKINVLYRRIVNDALDEAPRTRRK